MITILHQRVLKKILSFLIYENEPRTIFYFGYGANIDPDFFKQRFKNIEVIGLGRLPNYKFSINVPCEYLGKGFGGIAKDKSSEVYGTVYKISKSSLRLLNIIEWVPFNFYSTKNMEIICGETTLNAVVYDPCFTQEGLSTSEGYKKLLIQGANKVGFPKKYIEYLETLPTAEAFELDHDFNLSYPGKRRFLNGTYYKLHDKLREKLCNII